MAIVLTVAGTAGGASACGAGHETPATRDRTAPARAVAPAPPVPAERVRFRATDGRPVRAVLRLAPKLPAPAVLLLHQINGGAEQWDRFAPVLHRAGFTTLAYSGRGGWDVGQLAREARGALRYLHGRDDVLPRRVSVVGASIGGATALWLSTTLPPRDVPATVALSPAMEKPLLDAQDAGTYRPHDVLFVTNGHDAYASRSLRPGTRRARLLLDPDGGHGVELLTSRRVASAVLDWLRR